MGRYKCAYNCESTGDPDVKFFKFPLYNPQKLKKWLVNMNRKEWTPARFSMLCINHFEEQYIDRTGKSVTLKEDAVPTIFSSSGDVQKRKRKAFAKSKQRQSKMSTTQSPTAAPTSKRNTKGSRKTEDSAGDSKKSNRWRIIVDEGLMKIDSFPHFFHGDYCVPQQDIQWAPDNNEENAESEDPEKVIEVTEPWQWLGLDVRGPLPETLNGHKYILTVTDYFSKWVEAVPMESCLHSHVANHIVDIIANFGYPFRILSRLPHDIVFKINSELKDQLKVPISLVVSHQQTGTADLITQQLIDRMVNDLIKEHAADWDVYLPAKVFSLCFKDHSKTKEKPFSLLCCKGVEPVQSPRGLNYTSSKIQESAFMVR